jgi:taurine dioxygenase
MKPPDMHRMTGFIGVEIDSVARSKLSSPALVRYLQEALGQYHVVVVRDLFASLAEQKRLTAELGEPMQFPYIESMPGETHVIAVCKEASERNTGVFGGDWHSEFSFLANPPAGSVLNAVEQLPVGGDTIWANQVAAYEALDPPLQDFVATHRAVRVGKPYGVRHAPAPTTHANAMMRMPGDDPLADRETLHPAVLTVDDTGTRALFVNLIYTTRFEGLSEAQSTP